MNSTLIGACALAYLLVSCSRQQLRQTSFEELNSVAITNLDSFFLAQMERHRVLLLGEGRGHNDHAANGAVISLLSCWLDQIESGADVPRKLTLALEYPGGVGDQLRAYFASGDVSHFGLELQGRTVSTLLFFHNLRKLHARAQAMEATHHVDLQIFCPEHDYPLSLSPEERRRLAYTERDDRTAEAVLSYLQATPHCLFVAFYGAGHVADRPEPIAETTPWGVQIREHGIDVYTVVLIGFETTRYPLPFDRMSTDFALTSGSLATLVPRYERRVEAEAYYRQPYVHTVRLKDVPSRLVVSRALDYAEDLPELTPAIASLWYRFSGRYIPEDADVVRYIRDHLDQLHPLDAIEDLVLLKRVLAELNARNRPRAEIDRMMFGLTCFENVLDRSPYPVPAGASAVELWTRVMRDYEEQIKASLYTSVLLYGTREEQAAAAARLRALSGSNFRDPEEWFEYSWHLWDSVTGKPDRHDTPAPRG